MAAAQIAYDKGEYRWTSELLNHVVFAQPDHKAAKNCKPRVWNKWVSWLNQRSGEIFI
ncbi:MAG: hypothetical protein IPP41_15390 [Rhodocyclaceae bacterium]|nr:hypothetical protein [Rhodocyclaceae bacterium]